MSWETSATDDASLPRSGWCLWLAEANFPRGTANQKHCPDLSSDASSVWNICASVITRRNQWWRREMLALACEQALLFGPVTQVSRERARAPRSRVLARLTSLAQIGELARRLVSALLYRTHLRKQYKRLHWHRLFLKKNDKTYFSGTVELFLHLRTFFPTLWCFSRVIELRPFLRFFSFTG